MAAEVDTKELMQPTERSEENRYIKSEQHDRIADKDCPDEFQIIGGSDKPPQASENFKNAENKQSDCSIRDILQSINKSNVEISEGESFLVSLSAAAVVYKTSGMSAKSHAGEMTFEAAAYLETKTNVDVIEEFSGKSELDYQKDLNGSELGAKEDLNMPSRLGENVETETSICSESDVTLSVSNTDDAPTVVTKDLLGKHESGPHIVTEHEEIPSIGIQHIVESTKEMEVTMLDEDETGETEGQSLHREGNSDATKIAVEIKSAEEASEIKVNRREADGLAAKVVQIGSTDKEKSDNSVDSPFMTQEEKIQSQNEDLTKADISEAQSSGRESEADVDKERHTEDEACKSMSPISEHPLTEEFQKETIGNAAEGDMHKHFETKTEASVEICSKESEDKRDKCFEGVALQEEPLQKYGVNESNSKDHERAMRLEENDALSTDLKHASNEENPITILTDDARIEDRCESFSKSEPDGEDKLSKETDQNHENSERSSTYMNKPKENHRECMEQTCFEASIDKQEEREPCILLSEENSGDAELNEVNKENEMETSNEEYRPEKSMNENEGQEKLLMSSNEISEESEAHTFDRKAHQAKNSENYSTTEENLSYEKGEQVTAPEDVQEKEIKAEEDDDANDNQPKDFQAAELIEGCSKETSLPRKEDNLMEAEIKEVQENKEVKEEESTMNDCHSLEVPNLETKTEGEISEIFAGDKALQENEHQGKPSTIVQIDMKQDDASNFGKTNGMESSVTDAAEGRLDQKMQEAAPDAETEEVKKVDIVEKLSEDTLQENLKETSTLKLQEYEFPNAETNETVNKTSEKDGSLEQIVESTFITNGADEVLTQKEDKLTKEEYVTESELPENATDGTKVQGSEDLLHTKVDSENESKSAEVSREETREIADHTEGYQLNPLSEEVATLGADSAEKESGEDIKHIATFEATADVEKYPGSNLEEQNELEKEGCHAEANAQNKQMLNGHTIASGCIEMIQSGEQSETKNLEVEEDPGKQSERCVAELSDDGTDKPTDNLTIVAEGSSKTNQDKIFEKTGNCNDMVDSAVVTGATEITFRKAEVDNMPVTAPATCLDMGPDENAGNDHVQHDEEIQNMKMDETSSMSTIMNDQKKNEEENSTVQYPCEIVADARTTSLSIQEYNRDVKEVERSDISSNVENTKQAGVKGILEALTKSSIQEEGTASADARTAEQNEQTTMMLPQSTLTGLFAEEPTNRNTNNTEQVEEYSTKEKDLQQKVSLEIPPPGAIEGTCTNEEDLRKDGVTSETLAKEVQKNPPEEDDGKGHTTNEVPTMDPQARAGKTESQESPLESEGNKEESVETKENSALLECCGTSTNLSEIIECEVSTTSVCAIADGTTFEEVTKDCEPAKQFEARNDATDMALEISNEKVYEEQTNAGDMEEVQEHKTKEAKEVHEISNVTTTVTKETIPGSSSAENAKSTSLQEQTTALAAECEEISPDKSEGITEPLLNGDFQNSNSSVTSQETENPDAGMHITEKSSSCYDANIGATVSAETIENNSEACFEKEESKQQEASNMEIPLVTESTTDKGDNGEGRTAMESPKEESQLEKETEICIESDGFNEAPLSDEQIKERNLESTEETAWQIQSHEGKIPELSTIRAKDAAEDIKEEIPGDSDTSHGKTDAKVEELCTGTKEYNQGNSDESQEKIYTVVEALKPEAPKEAITTICYDSPSGIEENEELRTTISERLSLEIPTGEGSKISGDENVNSESEPVDETEKQCAEATEGHDDGCNEISLEEVGPEHGIHNEIDDIEEIQMGEADGAKDIQETSPANSPVNKGRDNASVSSEFSKTTVEICTTEGEPGACIASEGETKANSGRRDAPHEHQNESNNNIEARPETQEQEVRETQCTDPTAIGQENMDPATQREEVLKFLSENSKAACHGASESQPRDYLMEAGMENAETKFLNIDSKPVDLEPEKGNEMELLRNDPTDDDAIDKEVDAGQGKPDEIGNSNEKHKDEADDAKEVQETPTSSTISKERDIGSTSTEYSKVTAEVCINREEQSEHKLPETVTEANQGNYFTAKESEKEANIQNEAPEADPQEVNATSYVESREFCQQNMEVSKETEKASDIMVEKSETVSEVKPEIPSHGSLMEALPTDAKKGNLNAELETSHSDPGNQSMKPFDENDDTCDETFNGGVHAAEEKVDVTKTVEEHETEEIKAEDIHVILLTNSKINKERDSIAEHSETTGDKCIEGEPSASECETEDNSNKMDVVDEDQNEGKVEEGGPKLQFQEQKLSQMKCADFPIISKEDAESSTQIKKISEFASEESKIESEVTTDDQLHDTHTGGHKDAEIKNLNVESKLVDIEHEKHREKEIVKEDSSIGEASDKEVHATFEKAGEIEIKKDHDTAAANIDVTTIHKEKDIFLGSTEQSEMTEGKYIKSQQSSTFTIVKCEIEESGNKDAIMKEDQDESRIGDQEIKEEPQEEELSEIRGVVSSQVSQEKAQPCTMPDKEFDSVLYKSALECQPYESLKGALSEDAKLKNRDVEIESVGIMPTVIAAEGKDNKQEDTGDEKADESETAKEHKRENSGDVMDKEQVGNKSLQMPGINLVQIQEGDNIDESSETTGETCIQGEPRTSECQNEDSSNKRDVLDKHQNEGKIEEGPKPQFQDHEVSEIKCADFPNTSEDDAKSSKQIEEVSDQASEESTTKSAETSKDQSHDILTKGSKNADTENLNVESKLVDIEHEKEIVKEDSSVAEASDKEVHVAFEKAFEIDNNKDIDTVVANIDVTTPHKERDIFSRSIEQTEVTEGKCTENQESSAITALKCKIEESADKPAIMKEDLDESQIECQKTREETQEEELSEIEGVVSSQASQENAQSSKESDHVLHKSASESLKQTFSEDAELKSQDVELESANTVPSAIEAEEKENKLDEIGDKNADESETTKDHLIEISKEERDNIAEHTEIAGETCIQGEPNTSEFQKEGSSNKRDDHDKDQNEGKVEDGPKPQYQDQEVSEMKGADFPYIGEDDADSSTQIEEVSDHASEKCKTKSEATSEDQSHDILTGGPKGADIKNLNVESKLIDTEHEEQCDIEIVKEDSSVAEVSDKEVHAAFEKSSEIEIKKDIDEVAANIDVTTIDKERGIFSGSIEQIEVTDGKCIENQESSAITVSKCEIEESADKPAIVKEDQDESQIEGQKIREETQEEELSEIEVVVSSKVSQDNAQPCTMLDNESEHELHKSEGECQPHESLEGTLSEDAKPKSPDVESESVDTVPSVIVAEGKDNKQDDIGEKKSDESETTKESRTKCSNDVIDEEVGDKTLEVVGINSVLSQERDNITEHSEIAGETCIQGEPSTSEYQTEESSNKRDVLDKDKNEGKVEEGLKPQYQDQEVIKIKGADFPNIGEDDVESSTQIEEFLDHASEKSKTNSEATSEDQSHDILTGRPKDADIKNLNVESKLVDIDHEKWCGIEIVKEDSSFAEASDKEVHAAFEKSSETEIKKDIDEVAANIDVTTIHKKRDSFSGSIDQSEVTEGKCIENQESSAIIVLKCEIEESVDKPAIVKEDQDESQIDDQKFGEETSEEELSNVEGVVSSNFSQENAQPCITLDKESDHVLHKSAPERQPCESLKGTLSEDVELKSPDVESESGDIVSSVIVAEEKDNKHDEIGDKNADESESTKEHLIEISKEVIDEEERDNIAEHSETAGETCIQGEPSSSECETEESSNKRDVQDKDQNEGKIEDGPKPQYQDQEDSEIKGADFPNICEDDVESSTQIEEVSDDASEKCKTKSEGTSEDQAHDVLTGGPKDDNIKNLNVESKLVDTVHEERGDIEIVKEDSSAAEASDKEGHATFEKASEIEIKKDIDEVAARIDVTTIHKERDIFSGSIEQIEVTDRKCIKNQESSAITVSKWEIEESANKPAIVKEDQDESQIEGQKIREETQEEELSEIEVVVSSKVSQDNAQPCTMLDKESEQELHKSAGECQPHESLEGTLSEDAKPKSPDVESESVDTVPSVIAAEGKDNKQDDIGEKKADESETTKDSRTKCSNDVIDEEVGDKTLEVVGIYSVPSQDDIKAFFMQERENIAEHGETTGETCIHGEPSTSEYQTEESSNKRDVLDKDQNEGKVEEGLKPQYQDQEVIKIKGADFPNIGEDDVESSTQIEEFLDHASEKSKTNSEATSEDQSHDILTGRPKDADIKNLNVESKLVDIDHEKWCGIEIVKQDSSFAEASDKEVHAAFEKSSETEIKKDIDEVAANIDVTTIHKERDSFSGSIEQSEVTEGKCMENQESSAITILKCEIEESVDKPAIVKEDQDDSQIDNQKVGEETHEEEFSEIEGVVSSNFSQENAQPCITLDKESDHVLHKSAPERQPCESLKGTLSEDVELKSPDVESESGDIVPSVILAEEKDNKQDEIGNKNADESESTKEHLIEISKEVIDEEERDNIAEHSETAGETCIQGEPSSSECETEESSNKRDVQDKDQNEGKIEDGPKPQYQDQEDSEIKGADFPNICEDDVESSTQIEEVSDDASEKCKTKSEGTSEDQAHDVLTGGPKDANIKDLKIESKLVDTEHEERCDLEIVKEDSSVAEASDKEGHATFEKASEIEIKKDIDEVAASIGVTTMHKERSIFSGSIEQIEVTDGKCIENQESSAITVSKCEIEESADKPTIVKEDQDESQIEGQKIREETQEEELSEIEVVVSSKFSQDNAQPCTTLDKESEQELPKSAGECQPHEILEGTLSEDAKPKSPDVESESVDTVPSVIAAEGKDNKQDDIGEKKADESETTKESRTKWSNDVIDEEVGDKTLEVVGIYSVPSQERENIAEHGETTGETCIHGEPSTSEYQTEESSNKRDVLDKDQNEGKVEEGLKPQYQDQEVIKIKGADFPNIGEDDVESSTQIEEVSDHASEKNKIKSEATFEDQSHDILTGGRKDADIKNLNVESKLVDIRHEKQCEIDIAKEDSSVAEVSDKEVLAAFEKAGGIEIKKDIDAVAANIDGTISKERDVSSGFPEQNEVTEVKCIQNKNSGASTISDEIEESGNETAIMNEDQDEGQIEDQRIREEPQEQELSEIRGVISSQVSQENAQPCTTLDKESDHVLHKSAQECQPRESLKETVLAEAELKSPDVESESADTVPSVIVAEQIDNKQDQTKEVRRIHGKADECETTKAHAIETFDDVIEEVASDNSPETERDYISEHHETTGETKIEGEPSASECEIEDNSNKRKVPDEDQNQGKAEEVPKPQVQEQEVSEVNCVDFLNINQKDAESSTQIEKVLDSASEKCKIKSKMISEDQSQDILTGGPKDAEIKDLNIGSKLVDIEQGKHSEIKIVKEDSSIGEASNKEVAAFEKASEIEIKKDIDTAAANIDATTIHKEKDIFSGLTKQSEATEGKCTKDQESVLTRDTQISKEKDVSLVVLEHAEALDLGEGKEAVHASTAEVLEKQGLNGEKNGFSMEPIKTPEEDEEEIKEEAGSFYDNKRATSSTIEVTGASSLETREDEEHTLVQDPDIKETQFLEAERTDTSLRIIKEEVMVENTSPQTIPQQIIQCENGKEHSVAVQSPNEPVQQSEDPGAKAMDIAERAISEKKLDATETEGESATTYNETVIMIPQNGNSLIGEKITSETPLMKDLQADVQSQPLVTTVVSDEKDIELSSLHQNIEDGNRVQDAVQEKESLEAPVKQMEETEDTQDTLIKEDKKGGIPSDVLKLEDPEKEKYAKCAFLASIEQEMESDTLTKEASIPILGKITRACKVSEDEVSNRQIFGKQEPNPIHKKVTEERYCDDKLEEEETPNKSLTNEVEPEVRNQEHKTPIGSIMVEAAVLKEEVSSAENFQKEASLDREEENKTIPDRDLQVKNSVVVPGGEVPRETPLHTETVVSNDNENASPILKARFSETSEKVEAGKNLTEVNSAVEQVKQEGEVGKQSLSGNAKENPMSADASATSLSDLLLKSTKDTLQMVKDLAEKKEPAEAKLEVQSWETEVIEHEEAKTDEEREEVGEDENRETETAQVAPLLAVNSKDAGIKVPHKKSHNILSGVGSKVKHSISKVKKAITGKSSHSKTAHSPK